MHSILPFLGNREGMWYKHWWKMNWLPVVERIKQFVAVVVYKFSNKLAPIYMEDIFIRSVNTRRTR